MSSQQWMAVTVAIAVAVLWLYAPALNYGYVWDDWVWLDKLKSYPGNPLELAFLEPFLNGNRYWRPLGALTLYFQPAGNPEFYQHLFNLLLHLLNVGLLSSLGWHGLKNRGSVVYRWFWLFLLCIFAFHPVFIEPIVWVSGRFDLLFTTLLLLCLGVYLLIGNGIARLLLLGVVYSSALLVKETAILTLPMLLIFGHLAMPAATFSELLSRDRGVIASFIAISVGYLVARAVVLDDLGIALLLSGGGDFSLTGLVYELLTTVGAYLQLLFFPFLDLSTLHPREAMLANPIYSLVGALFLLATGLSLWRGGQARTAGWVATGFLVSLLLVLNIIPEGFTDNLVQNRYLYPSLAFVVCCLAVCSFELSLTLTAKKTLAIAGVGWLGLACLNMTITIPLWRSQESLTAWLVSENPQSTYAINLKGMHYLDAGDMEAAIETVGEEASRNPTYDGYMVLGLAHFGLGICRDALIYYDYAYQMGIRGQKADALLGKYAIYSEIDPVQAKETKERLMRLTQGREDYSGRLDRADNGTVECRDTPDARQ